MYLFFFFVTRTSTTSPGIIPGTKSTISSTFAIALPSEPMSVIVTPLSMGNCFFLPTLFYLYSLKNSYPANNAGTEACE